MNVPSKIDPDRINIPDDAWEFVEATEDFLTHRAVFERNADGSVTYVYRRTPRALVPFLEDNRRSFDDSASQRFGDGKIVASIPLNVMFDPKFQIAEKLREGDKDHLKWFLNRSDNRMFRRFRGQL